jgi:hypothetical protein
MRTRLGQSVLSLACDQRSAAVLMVRGQLLSAMPGRASAFGARATQGDTRIYSGLARFVRFQKVSECVAQCGPGGDAEFGEDLVQVGPDGAV